MKQKQNTFTILFYIRRAQMNKQGECAVMCRLTIRGERENFSTRVYTSPEIWDSKSGRIMGRSSKIMEQNKVLNDLQVTLSRHYYDIEQRNGYVTAEMVKNAYMGVTAKAESLIPIYKEFLEETKSLVGIQKSQKTYDKYDRCFRRVVEFMKSKYKISDIPLRDLKPMFLVDFEVFLATKKNCAPNTIYKFLQLLRMPIIKAQKMGIIFKDLFIFACYTGLAYSDLAALKPENIQKMFDGKMWIVTHRQKTKTNVNVPLLGPAQRILDKYAGTLPEGQVLPVISNQKCNSYLKEIADICEIEQKLTFHLARHTFATTMTLGKGVPIESVSKMLGHTNIATTQIYARITNDKISKDMDTLANNLGALDF